MLGMRGSVTPEVGPFEAAVPLPAADSPDDATIASVAGTVTTVRKALDS